MENLNGWKVALHRLRGDDSVRERRLSGQQVSALLNFWRVGSRTQTLRCLEAETNMLLCSVNLDST